ncbi:L,D-transpeptidase family protein [Erythrobacter sp.]|nr:L,D-transpeptidase family protein [Erythrobacter sp.]
MTRTLTILASLGMLSLSACNVKTADADDAATQTAESASTTDYGYDVYGDDNLADTMASNDDGSMGTPAAGNTMAPVSSDRASRPVEGASGLESTDGPDADTQERPVMQAQVVLDRQGFGPGVIDGEMGKSTENALRGFQEVNELEVTGKMDEQTEQALQEWDRIPATRMVTIPASWSDAEFTDMPEDVAKKAELESLGYKSLDEKLAERFHTTVAVLKSLNPEGESAGGATPQPTPTPTPTPDVARQDGDKPSFFRAGQEIRVPNIGADKIAPGSIDDRSWQRTLASLGVGTEQPEVDRIVVSKSKDTLRAYQGDKLVALFTVSSGSSQFPLPIGDWDIVGQAYNPPYSYDPEVLGNTDDDDGEKYTLPPGPNSPVGVVWIDLSKEHYGIHGTPDPETIGRAQSSGCVRLTNWDAARLSQMVSTSTEVIFEA